MAVTTAVTAVSAGLAIKNARDQKKAQEKADEGIKSAQLQEAKNIRRAGLRGQADILSGARGAAANVGRGVDRALRPIEMFVEPGEEAFRQFSERTMTNSDLSGPLADAISSGAMEAVDPSVFNVSQDIQPELERQAQLRVSEATPFFNQALETAARQGVAAVGDTSQLRQRGLESLADIAGSTAAGRASVIQGQVAPFAQLQQGARNSRVLGQITGQQANSNIINAALQGGGLIYGATKR